MFDLGLIWQSFHQRKVVWLIAIFFSLILFNTTFMSLGTIVPLGVAGLLLWISMTSEELAVNRYKLAMLIFAIIIAIATFFSGGEIDRAYLKILLMVLVYVFVTSLPYTDREVSFLSLAICISYCVYALLVVDSIGATDVVYHGRAELRILNSEIALDPNVVAGCFVLPSIMSLYNLLYGSRKILATVLLLLLFIAIVATGSRGAFVGLAFSAASLLVPFVFQRDLNGSSKFVIVLLIGIGLYYAVTFLNSQDSIMGFDRLFEDDGDATGNGRTVIWADRFNLFWESPLLGYGVNLDMGHFRGWACHNTFVQIMYFSGGGRNFLLLLSNL